MSAPERVFSTAAEALCWATEVELATLERYRDLKGASKSERERHERIAATLLRACEQFVDTFAARRQRCPRVERHLAAKGGAK